MVVCAGIIAIAIVVSIACCFYETKNIDLD